MTKKKLLLSLGLVVVGLVAFITLLVFPTISEIRNFPLVENTLTRVLCQYGQRLWVYADPFNPSEYPLYCTNVEGVGYNAINPLILIDAVLVGLFLTSGYGSFSASHPKSKQALPTIPRSRLFLKGQSAAC
jgi:hypothetical protein